MAGGAAGGAGAAGAVAGGALASGRRLYLLLNIANNKAIEPLMPALTKPVKTLIRASVTSIWRCLWSCSLMTSNKRSTLSSSKDSRTATCTLAFMLASSITRLQAACSNLLRHRSLVNGRFDYTANTHIYPIHRPT